MSDKKNLQLCSVRYNRALLALVILLPIVASVLCLFLKGKALLYLLSAVCIFLCVLSWIAYKKIYYPWSEDIREEINEEVKCSL